tara:strand:+ start:507 stop:1484 length:978 start_codon:yes stop_codon:yes gene_type:complete
MTLSTHKQAVNGTSFATASITFTGAATADETIVIVDGAGLSKTYTAKNSSSATDLEFIKTDKDAAATALKAAIEHANGHNGSITVTNTPAGTITLTLTTAGQVGTDAGDIPALITEGLSNCTATAFSGGNLGPEAKDKHTILGGGTTGGYNVKSNIKSNIDVVVGGKAIGSKIIAKTGSIGKAGVEKAFASGGTLAYNPNARSVTRSATDTGFLIRGGTFTKLSGKASTEDFLAIPGSADLRNRIQNGARHYHRKGTWATQVFDLYAGLLKQSDGTDKSGITGRGTTVDLSQDWEPTRAIPGELIILFNFASFTTNYVDYSELLG